MAEELRCGAVDICAADASASGSAALPLPETEDEAVGFAFPIHGWQPPRVMRRFVRSLPYSLFADRYVFAVCTCGDETGDALKVFDGELRRRGMRLDMCASVQMPNTYVCLPFMDTDPKDVEREKLERARTAVERLAGAVRRRERGEHLVKGSVPWLLTHVIGEYFNRRMVGDGKLGVDAAKCIHCGKCREACPVGNVAAAANTAAGFLPEWRRNGSCTGCLACYHVCPRHAVSYGKITRGRGQYIHPSK